MNQKADLLLSKLPEQSAYISLRPENRRYLTGIATSNGLVLVCEQKQIFFTDFRYITMAQASIAPGYEVRLFTASVAETVRQILADTDVTTVYFEDAFVTYREYCRLAETLNAYMLVGDELVLSQLRMVKAPEEIEKIRAAQKITDDAFLYICRFLSNEWPSGTLTEVQVAAELDYAMRKAGSGPVAFDTIVASGENGAKPHAVPGKRVLQKGDFVTMDFGATYDGYAADMTRTVALGNVSDLQKKVYRIVLEAQQKGMERICAGKTGDSVDAGARDWIAAAGYGEYFGHSLGHGVGLQIHEMPNFSPKYTQQVPSGAVMSVEPGIYLPEQFGVRIEDLVVVRENGYENLTQSSKELLFL